MIGVGSGGSFAMAAARAMLLHTDKPAIDIAREALRIASEICIYTNATVVAEEVAAT